jgi:hypothetical protein
LAAACDAAPAGPDVRALPAPGKADAQTSGLPMITEYVEASFGSNKGIEIYNPLPFAVSMDACAVRVFSNGRSEPNLRVQLEGSVMQPAGTLTVCHPSATVFGDCDVESGSLNFNGNDAVDLACDFGNGPITLDVVGVVGDDPGSAGWVIDEAAGQRTRDMTIRRACSVAAGHDSFEADQWVAAGKDAFDDFGEHEPCASEPGPEPTACSLGADILGGPASAIWEGAHPEFDVHIHETIFANFTARTGQLLFEAYTHFAAFSGGEEVVDAAAALAAVARDNTSQVEFSTILDTDTGIEYEALRYRANDATWHSIVKVAGTDDTVAFSFDGEFFDCDPTFCSSGDLTRPFFEQLDEDFQPVDRYSVVESTTVLDWFLRRSRVFRNGDDPTLLTVAWAAHTGEQLSSTEVLEQIARDGTGTLVYEFVAGPSEDYEGVVFTVNDATDHGMLVVEDALDVEALTFDGEVTVCAPPPA